MNLRKDKIRIYLSQSETDAIKYATEDLRNDLSSTVCENTEYNKNFDIFVGNLSNDETCEFLDNAGIYYKDIAGKKEAHKVGVAFEKCFLLGSDVLGTIYAIYEFCTSTLGVSPFAYWTGEGAKRQDIVRIKSMVVTNFAYEYRCFSIGDEDCLSTLSVSNKQRYSHKDKFSHVTDAEFIIEACKTALRLKYNLVVPATMLNIMNPHEEAIIKCITSLGLFVTQNPYEPLGVSLNTWNYYWTSKDKEGIKPSYDENKEFFLRIWEDYVDRWSDYPNVLWQLGLNCKQYSHCVFYDERKVKSAQDRFEIVCDALDAQCSLVYDLVENEDVKFILFEDDYNSPVLADKRFSLSDNVIVVRYDGKPYKAKKRKKEFSSLGSWYMGANTSFGEHNVQYPDVDLNKSISSMHKRSALIGVSVGNIRERLLNIYSVAQSAVSEVRGASAVLDFSVMTYESRDGARAYTEFGEAYFSEGLLLTDITAYETSLTVLKKIEDGANLDRIAFSDFYGRKKSFARRKLIALLENAMIRLVQYLFNAKHVYERKSGLTYYQYSMIDQPTALLKAYSALANLLRYSIGKEDKYKTLAIEDMTEVKNCYEKMAYGRWQGAYRKNHIDYQILINKTKEI